jgi:hypothetical protein
LLSPALLLEVDFPLFGASSLLLRRLCRLELEREGRRLVQRRSRPPIVDYMPVAVNWWLDLGAHIWPRLRFLLLFLELLSSEQKTMEKVVAPMNKSVML